jgi:uncharacterized protein with LGFP repeats
MGGKDYPAFSAGTRRSCAFIYSSQLGEFVVSEPIGECYESSSGADGPLGFPIRERNDRYSPDQFQRFEDGTIYWTKENGTITVSGRIHIHHIRQADELGWPVSPLQAFGDGSGLIQFFEHGVITDRSGHVEHWISLQTR